MEICELCLAVMRRVFGIGQPGEEMGHEGVEEEIEWLERVVEGEGGSKCIVKMEVKMEEEARRKKNKD